MSSYDKGGYPQQTVVVSQPAQFGGIPGHRPSDYLILSIIAIFFCWPMAICAIMYSLNSRSAADAGDMGKAESDGRVARNIGIAALVFGLVIVVIAVAVPLALAASYTATICTGFGC